VTMSSSSFKRVHDCRVEEACTYSVAFLFAVGSGFVLL
jgi:hypothetical protein